MHAIPIAMMQTVHRTDCCEFENETIKVATTVAIPALPASIRSMMIRRRTGWTSNASDSEVVNPTPLYADLAWNLALSGDMPVNVRAVAATFVIASDSATTNKSRTMAV